jgi:hypothetical protein
MNDLTEKSNTSDTIVTYSLTNKNQKPIISYKDNSYNVGTYVAFDTGITTKDGIGYGITDKLGSCKMIYEKNKYRPRTIGLEEFKHSAYTGFTLYEILNDKVLNELYF